MARPDFKHIKETYGDKLPKYAGGSWMSTVWLNHKSGSLLFNLDEYTDVQYVDSSDRSPVFTITDDEGNIKAPICLKYEIWLNASREALRQARMVRDDEWYGPQGDGFGGHAHLIDQYAHFYALFVSYVSDPELIIERDYLPDYD